MSSLQQLKQKCSSRPFWIWDKEAHQIADKVFGNACCFNHLIGLPVKQGKELAMFDYEQKLHDALLRDKHIWVKKATGLGVTEFMLRFMAWLALSDKGARDYQIDYGSIFTIVTGPRLDLALDLISRFKKLFERVGITFEDKNTVVNLDGVKVEAFPSHHLDSMRGLPDVKFILLDEADFFPPGEQQDARDVSERYIGKSDPFIAMVSTPNNPGGLFARLEQEPEQSTIYHRIVLGYQVGLDKIYTQQDIERAKQSPSFEREYNLQYLGAIGNIFSKEDIDASITNYEIHQYMDDTIDPPLLQGIMGIDPGWGSSNFGIVVSQFVDGKVRIMFADEFSRQGHEEMVREVWDLIQRFNINKVLIDASAPSFIRALKLQWGERPDYEQVPKQQRQWMKVEPVAFGMEHKALLYHAKFMMENHYIQVRTDMQKLITALRSAWANDGVLDKDTTSYDDIIDALRLCLRPFKEQTNDG